MLPVHPWQQLNAQPAPGKPDRSIAAEGTQGPAARSGCRAGIPCHNRKCGIACWLCGSDKWEGERGLDLRENEEFGGAGLYLSKRRSADGAPYVELMANRIALPYKKIAEFRTAYAHRIFQHSVEDRFKLPGRT